MVSASSTQFNVRIDSAVKTEGDRIFAAIGFTPTNAVRALYELAVRNKNNPEVVLTTLGMGHSESAHDEKKRTMQRSADEGRLIFSSALKDLGIDAADTVLSDNPHERALQYKEMARTAAYEKYNEG